MTFAVRLAVPAEKTGVADLMRRYYGELSAFGAHDDLDPYFDLYWSEPGRWPYLVDVAGATAGFIFVNTYSPSGLGTDFSIAEFYISPGYRRQGIGTAALEYVLIHHPGQWELSILPGNRTAVSFWSRAIPAAGAVSWVQLDRPEYTVIRFTAEKQPPPARP
jgi:predicted acetyltransferase